MGERQNGRHRLDRVGKLIKEHADRKGGGMVSAMEASQQAAEIARNADAMREVGADRNPRKRDLGQPIVERKPNLLRRRAPNTVYVDFGRMNRG